MKQPAHDFVRLLQAQWVLGETRADLVPGICTDLLVGGYDTQSLRVLAGLSGAELERVPDLLRDLFREMGMGQLSRVQAAWCIAQNTARDIISGKTSPYDGAQAIGHFGTNFDPLFPSLSIFIGLWSEWDDHPAHREEYESDIREEASRLIAEGPPPEPGTGSEVDRLAKLASQRNPARQPDMTAVGWDLASKVPAGHILAGRGERWTAIATHNDRAVLLLHTTLPFGFIRQEYRRYVESLVDEAGIHLADVASADTVQLSVTTETIQTLAGREIVLRQQVGWLSANQLRKLTEE